MKAQEAGDRAMQATRMQQAAALRKRNEDLREAGPRIALKRLKDKKRREQVLLVND